jgi:hypothetical protein
VTKRIPQPRSELSPSIRAHEAQLLAVMLRTSKLTWVFGEPGTDKTALLKAGVLPLLQRRRGDRFSPVPELASVPEAAERRRRGSISHVHPPPQRIEAAIYFDDWSDAPLRALKNRVVDVLPAASRADVPPGARLSDLLAALNRRPGLEIVFLLDRFEALLARSAEEPEYTAFVDELVEAVLRPGLRTGCVIALEDEARPRLERLRSRIPGFDHNVLRLTPVRELPEPAPESLSPARAMTAASEPPMQRESRPTPSAGGPGGRPSRHRCPPRVPIKIGDVYSLIESTLAKTSVQAGSEAMEWAGAIADMRVRGSP